MRAYPYLFAVGYPCLPTCIRMDVVELVIGSLVVMVIPLVVTGSLVVVVVPLVGPMVVFFNNVGEAVAGRDCGSCINDVGTGTVKSYRIE